jgi:hypothetical protein
VSERTAQATLDRPAGALPAPPRRAAGAGAREHPLAALHRALGNQLIQRRAEPPIAAPEDEHEREAERVAALVAGGGTVGAIGSAAPAIGRQADDERKRRELPPPAKPPPAPKPPAAAPRKVPEPPKKPDPGRARPTAPATGVAQTPAAAPPRPLGERPAGERKREEEPAIAMKAEGAGPTVTPDVSATIAGAHGSGRPLPQATRAYFEQRLGQDLSGVRVHDDVPAARAARDLRAQAFTYGQDVFFGAGRFQPGTPDGRRLLAHELTHTAQQHPGARLHRQAIQRNGEGSPPATGAQAQPPVAGSLDPHGFTPDIGRLEGEGPEQTILFDRIEIPRFKTQDHRGELYGSHKPLHRVKRYDRGAPRQRDKWRDEVPGTPAVVDALRAKAPAPPPEGGPYLFAAPAPRRDLPLRYFIGDLQTIAKEMNLPSWDAAGKSHEYDVDHIVELQLAGWDKTPTHWANQLPNMELLDSSANRSSGTRIADNVDERVKSFLKATQSTPGYPRSPDTLGRGFHLKFQEAVPEAREMPRVGRNEYWRQSEIEAGDHVRLDAVRLAHASELGEEGRVKVFSRPTGGVAKSFTWSGKTTPASEEADWLEPFTITQKTFNVGPDQRTDPMLGTLTIALPGGDEKWEPVPATPVPLQRIPGLPFAGHIDRQAMRASVAGFRKKGASPIRLEEDPDVLPQGGIGVRGQIVPEIPALAGVGIDFEVAGSDIRVWKTFTIEDVKVPQPFVVTDVSLTASAGTRSGLQLTGQVDFEIQRVGQGMLRAGAGTQRGIEFEGEFNFSQRLFDPARIAVAYRDGAWSGAGDLGIPPGKVPGIRRGLFHASYSEGRLEATGSAETTIPGVSQATMALSYSEAEGLAIGGELTLAPTIPGLRGGQLKARVEERPDQGDYRVTAHGEAQPAIPGIDATLSVDYDDGALTVQGQAAYSRGPVSGQLTLGATNRPVDAEGNVVPTGAPTGRLTAFGGGQASVQLTPWLRGTIGMRILPNGQLELAGAIGLPATVELFPEKSYTRNIITIGIDIPIVGVAVLGQRIGIFATIQGGLDFSAGVGPGQLRELSLAVTFNPDQPDRTHVEGGAQLHIPAHAGLRLFVRGGLGAGIPIVSASAGLEVGGALGLQGAVDASVHVDWMPTRGLVLDALGEVYVEPRFRFDVTGFVLVEADLLLKTVELYSKRWQLAAVEYGSGLRLGMRVPIHYEEGRAFDVSWSDVQFQIPDVSPREVLSGLIEQIK